MTKFKKKYCQHKRNAIKRNILWEITYIQWIKIWLESGKWSQRGCRKGQYCMARFNDEGPYAPDNVKIILHAENTQEAHTISQRMPGKKYFLGKKHTDETKHKLSILNTGKKLSTETRAKMSNAQMGNKNGFFGRTHTKEARAKISAACKRRVGMKYNTKKRKLANG